MRPSLRQDDFEMEKKVIVEEIQMYLDQPPYGMDDRLKTLCFGQHPIANSVIGSEASGGARNIFAERCRMDSPRLDRGLRGQLGDRLPGAPGCWRCAG